MGYIIHIPCSLGEPEMTDNPALTDNPILYKKLEPIQIAFIKTCIDSREQLPPLFDRLQFVCGEDIDGEAMAIFHGGAVKDGYLVEVAYPVARAVETGEVHTRLLEAAKALTILHYGSHQVINMVFSELGSVYNSPVVQTQDLTVLNVTKEAIVARQAKQFDQLPPTPGVQRVGFTPVAMPPPDW
jgi:hypothetical protein